MIARLNVALAFLGLAFLALVSYAWAQESAAPADGSSVQTADSSAAPAKPTGDAPADMPEDTPTAETKGESFEAPTSDGTASGSEVDERSAKLKELLTLVQDNTTKLHKRESPAYFMLIKDVMDRTPEQLRNEITINPRFNDLYHHPSDYRGKLVHVRLNARRVLPIDISVRNAAGVTRLYEIWGWTEEAKVWMYCCVVPELPAGFPEEGDVSESIELTGYFFKMQAYNPGNAAPDARNLVAPLVLGRIVYAAPVNAQADDSIGNWPLILIIGFGCIVMFRLMLHLRGMGRTPPVRRNYRRRSLEPIDAEALNDALDLPERGLRIRNANEV